jgi:CheY-like chemotaxis protein
MDHSAPDILLVEDIRETVEGLELDLRSRGGSVFLASTGAKAEQDIREDSWALILFDLRIPYEDGDDPRLEVGVSLIRAMVSGGLGELNRQTPFAVITQQAVVPEAEEFEELDSCLGLFSKSEDSRRLFRVLQERGLLKEHEFDDTEAPEVRRRTKLMVRELDPHGRGNVTLSAPFLGDERCVVSLTDFRQKVRKRIVDGPLPVFVYGTVNVAATSGAMLLPSDLDEFAELVPPRRLEVQDQA